VAALAQAFGKIVGTLAGAFATIIEALAPVLTQVAELFAQVVTALAPLVSVFATLVAAIAPLLAALVSGLMPVIQWMTKALVILVGGILQMFGATKTLDEMIRALEPGRNKDQSAGLQALTNPQYMGFAELGRTLALSAAVATGGPVEEKKDTPQWLSDISTTLKEMRSGQKTLKGIITEGVIAAMKGIVYEGAKGIYTQISDPFAGIPGNPVEMWRTAWQQRLGDGQ